MQNGKLKYINNYKYEIFLAIILIAFTAFKWGDLHLPYFWDELNYYAPAGLYMHDNGLGLLPSNLPPELSRGHPLLFQYLTGLWFKVFGTSLFAGHSFALTISLLALLSTYKLASIFVDKTYSLVTVGILATQPVFLAQSIMILPEVAILLFGNLALYYFFKHESEKYIVASVLLVFVRETAVIIPLCLLIVDFLISKKIKTSIKHITPIIVLSVFFIVQKVQNGWFFFPFHIELVDNSVLGIFQKVINSLYFIFFSQGRFVLIPFFIFGCYNLWKENRNLFITLIIVFAATILGFSMYMVLNRYYIYLLPVLIIISVYSFKRIKYGYLASILSISSIFHLTSETFNIDVDYGYQNAIKCAKQASKYLQSNNIESQQIYLQSSISNIYSDYRLGYHSSKIKYEATESKNKNITCALEINPNGWKTDFSDWDNFKLVKTIKEGNFEILIFKK